jgi:hypothetical protein
MKEKKTKQKEKQNSLHSPPVSPPFCPASPFLKQQKHLLSKQKKSL